LEWLAIAANGSGIQDVLLKALRKQNVPQAKGGFATAACMPCCRSVPVAIIFLQPARLLF